MMQDYLPYLRHDGKQQENQVSTNLQHLIEVKDLPVMIRQDSSSFI